MIRMQALPIVAGDLAAALEIVTPKSVSAGTSLQRLFFVGENTAAHTPRAVAFALCNSV